MMRRVESTGISDSLPIREVQSVLENYPVRLALLFGSRASGNAHGSSDTDIAVEFESVDRQNPAYNDVFLRLSADLRDVLSNDDVDLVDVHTLSSALAKAILERGVVLVGDQAHAEDLLRSTATTQSDERSPRERFDTALGKIDDHLGDAPSVPATDGSRGER
jgi:predicted nucleotidyltransferase